MNLARGTLTVPGTKTEAAARTVDLLPVLRDELAAWRAAARRSEPSALVFGTGTGKEQSKSHVRRRVLTPAVDRASAAMRERGDDPLPDGLTPHSLRRTFATILVARGENPRYVMGQMGHADPAFTMRVYTGEMSRRDGEHDRLRALVEGEPVPAVDVVGAPFWALVHPHGRGRAGA